MPPDCFINLYNNEGGLEKKTSSEKTMALSDNKQTLNSVDHNNENPESTLDSGSCLQSTIRYLQLGWGETLWGSNPHPSQIHPFL